MDVTQCRYCFMPFDGVFHHIECYGRLHLEIVREQAIPYTDLNACHTTIGLLMSAVHSHSDRATINWKGVTIYSHPMQKQSVNQNALHISQKDDGLGLIKDFWNNVRWVTDEELCPNLVKVVYQDGEHWLIRAAIWDFKLMAEWAQQHPITQLIK